MTPSEVDLSDLFLSEPQQEDFDLLQELVQEMAFLSDWEIEDA